MRNKGNEGGRRRKGDSFELIVCETLHERLGTFTIKFTVKLAMGGKSEVWVASVLDRATSALT